MDEFSSAMQVTPEQGLVAHFVQPGAGLPVPPRGKTGMLL
jgi:hypothetical protein